MKRTMVQLSVLLVFIAPALFGIDNLKLNQRLDYQSDSLDGPLITGDDAQSGFEPGKTNYVIIYGEGCFNSKRQARRTVELYNKYRNQVHFVVIDLDVRRSPAQQELVKRYYKGYIPHVAVLDAKGKALYNADGEVDSRVIEGLFEKSRAESRPSGEGSTDLVSGAQTIPLRIGVEGGSKHVASGPHSLQEDGK